jgi:hypothetical protein
MKAIIFTFTAVICTAIFSQISPASAQYYGYGQTSYYGPASMHYHYLSPAGACCALVTVNSGWAFTRNQPVGDVAPYPALQMADGTLGCEHSNYRPRRGGWCQRIW